jgi:hypothetical protein
MHAHSDLYLLTNPDHEAKITQGCTVRHSIQPDVTPTQVTPTERDAAPRCSYRGGGVHANRTPWLSPVK